MCPEERPVSSQPSLQEDVDESNNNNNNNNNNENGVQPKLIRADLVANVFLLVGGIFFVAFVGREIITFCRRDATADFLYSMAFACFVLNGGIQLFIDVWWTRSATVGRYSTFRNWNFIITGLFLAGIFMDFIAFVFWRQGGQGVPTERSMQWIGNHLWLLASVAVLKTNSIRWDTPEERMDSIANLFFLGEALMNLLARYLTDITPEEGDVLDMRELRLELTAAVFWIMNALFYVMGGCFRLREYKINRKKRTAAAAIDMTQANELEMEYAKEALEAVQASHPSNAMSV